MNQESEPPTYKYSPAYREIFKIIADGYRKIILLRLSYTTQTTGVQAMFTGLRTQPNESVLEKRNCKCFLQGNGEDLIYLHALGHI
jgi:hypothetical protein